MKKQYAAPQVTIYGSVESITKATGIDPSSDAIIFNGDPLNDATDGSNDIIL